MEKYSVTVCGIRVFDEKDTPSVELTLDKAVKGFVKATAEGGIVSFDEVDVTTISINRAQLTRELCDENELIADYRGCRTKAFDQKCFNLILRGATLEIVRERHTEGEPIIGADGQPVKDADGNDVVYKRDCYTTKVVAVKLTEKATAKLDAACTLD